jgi:cytochrome c5
MKLFSVKNVLWLFVTMMVASAAFAFAQEVQLPEGDAKKILQEKCTGCHDLTYVTKQHLTKDEWKDMIAIMVASGASVTDEETTVLVDYLVKNFGPADQQPQPAGQDSDGHAKQILDEKCTACHDLTYVTKQHLTKDEWKDMIAVMVASGASVTDDETTVLVEYLVKNFGPQ